MKLSCQFRNDNVRDTSDFVENSVRYRRIIRSDMASIFTVRKFINVQNWFNINAPQHGGGKHEPKNAQWVALLEVCINHVAGNQIKRALYNNGYRFGFNGVEIHKPLLAPINNWLEVIFECSYRFYFAWPNTAIMTGINRLDISIDNSLGTDDITKIMDEDKKKM